MARFIKVESINAIKLCAILKLTSASDVEHTDNNPFN